MADPKLTAEERLLLREIGRRLQRLRDYCFEELNESELDAAGSLTSRDLLKWVDLHGYGRRLWITDKGRALLTAKINQTEEGAGE